jgi:hypothetical protein
MNYRGSSRHLIRNAKSALLAAIEIYNKPGFQYRDECFVILLLNAWELYLKALISKSKASIYYLISASLLDHVGQCEQISENYFGKATKVFEILSRQRVLLVRGIISEITYVVSPLCQIGC